MSGIHAEPDRREELHVLWNNLAPPALNLSDASAIREYCDQMLVSFVFLYFVLGGWCSFSWQNHQVKSTMRSVADR